jgi:hypothetical protein
MVPGGGISSPDRGREMATKKVILYFDNQQDALRFTLAAGSVMADSKQPNAGTQALHLIQPLARATRIRVTRTASHEDEKQPTAKAG